MSPDEQNVVGSSQQSDSDLRLSIHWPSQRPPSQGRADQHITGLDPLENLRQFDPDEKPSKAPFTHFVWFLSLALHDFSRTPAERSDLPHT
jgi:hypothetical protein